MTFRIVVRYVEDMWFVSVDTLDDQSKKVNHAGDTFEALWQAMEFIEAEINRSGGD